jgi:23S rRNA (guanine745-N1)-methyltransferase
MSLTAFLLRREGLHGRAILARLDSSTGSRDRAPLALIALVRGAREAPESRPPIRRGNDVAAAGAALFVERGDRQDGAMRAPARLRCTVRGCARALELEGRVWRCAGGHAFDVARSGHVNLLQPQDRRSPRAGDERETVLARERLWQAGVGAELARRVHERAAELDIGPASAVLDVGCGPGLLLSSLAEARGAEGTGLDLAVAAIERAARRDPARRWVVANADRGLPFLDGSLDLLLSLRGPRDPVEFRRVLAARGAALVAVPAADDLIELRAEVLGEGRPIERAPAVLEEMRGFLRCRERETVRERRRLERPALADLLRATYRGARRAERARFEALADGLEVTLADELLLLVP